MAASTEPFRDPLGSPEGAEGPAGGGPAWDAIVKNIPKGYYRSGKDRLRAYKSFNDAKEGYFEEAKRHGAPVPAPFWLW